MRRLSSGPVRVLVLAGISTISKPFGLILTRTASWRERPRCSHGHFRRIGAKECGLQVGMATAPPPHLPTAQMDEAKPTGATLQGFPAMATLKPETAKAARAEATATISMRALCAWRRLSAQCC